MSSKRVKIKEMKRRQKQRKQLMLLGAVVAAVLIVIGITYAVYDNYNKGFVMTFEGQKVGVADMRFSMILSNAETEEEARAAGFDLLLTKMVLDKVARESGIFFTEEEKEEVASSADFFVQYMQYYGYDISFISRDRIEDITGTMDVMYRKLMDIYTGSFETDEADFAYELANYRETGKVDYHDIDIKYIYSYDFDEINSAHNSLTQGILFDIVWAMYSEDYPGYDEDEEGYDNQIQIHSLSDLFFEDYIMEEIMAMEADTFSGVYDLDGVYLIVYVVSSETRDADEVEATFRENYINAHKELMFQDIITEWKRNADFTVNQKGYEAA